jgi:flagellin
VNSARDDAAGIAIGSGLEAQRRGLIQAVRNLNDARGFLDTADGTLSTQTSIVQRMRELAIQAANGTLGSSDRAYLNAELQQLLEEFNRLTNQTQFNGVNLLDGSFGTKALQIGTTKGSTIDLSLATMQATAVFTQRLTVGTGTFQARTTVRAGSNPISVTTGDLNGDGVLDIVTGDYSGNTASVFLAVTRSKTVNPALDISTQDSAQDMLEVFDSALSYINSARATIGATQSRLDFAESVSGSTLENITRAKSQIMDADFAQEAAEFARLQILQQAGIAVLGQANLSLRTSLKLLENL